VSSVSANPHKVENAAYLLFVFFFSCSYPPMYKYVAQLAFPLEHAVFLAKLGKH